MKEERFEIEFLVDPDINDDFDIQALKQAGRMATQAAEEGKKGVILCQVYSSNCGDGAKIKGSFICHEAGLEIAEVFKKYGYL